MWIIFSILAAFCWSISYIIDKYIVTKLVRNPLVPIVALGIFGLIASAAVYFIHGFPPLSNFNILLSIIAGVIWGFGSIFYFRVVKTEEISRIVPIYHISPIFVSIFAGIFLGEIFTPIKYLGIILLVMGAVFVSSKNFLSIKVGKAFWSLILSAVFFASSYVLQKYLLNFADFWTIFAHMRIGSALALAPIMFLYFPELIRNIKEYGNRVIFAISASEIMNLTALVFIAIAASIGYITLVNTMSSLDSFFVLLFTVVLSRFFPSILKEEISKSIILQKVLAISLIFAGVILIT